MVLSLFRKPDPNPAAALYAAAVDEARRPGWYVDGGIPDTMDGRYCVLATLLALADVRLDKGSVDTKTLAPRLTELFIDDMDVQLRESGLGDPSLGKAVRGLVNGLSARIEHWEKLSGEETIDDWPAAIRSSLYRETKPAEADLRSATAMIEHWRRRLNRTADDCLREGVKE